MPSRCQTLPKTGSQWSAKVEQRWFPPFFCLKPKAFFVMYVGELPML